MLLEPLAMRLTQPIPLLAAQVQMPMFLSKTTSLLAQTAAQLLRGTTLERTKTLPQVWAIPTPFSPQRLIILIIAVTL